MIVPMNKYLFVLHHASSEHFLARLQELGLVDIVRGQKAIDEHSRKMHDGLLRYKSCCKFLSEFAPDTDVRALPAEQLDLSASQTDTDVRTLPAEQPDLSASQTDTDIRALPAEQLDLQALLSEIEEAAMRREQISGRLSSLRKEMEATAVWGTFSHSDRARIHQLGYNIHAYAVPEKRFDSTWTEHYPLFEMNRVNGTVYFILLHEHNTPFDFSISEVKFPDQDIRSLQAEMEKLGGEADAIKQRLTALHGAIELFQNEMKWLRSEFDRYLAGKSAQKEAEDHINILTGFAPKANSKEIQHFLESESILYLEQEAEVEDAPPVLLKNNLFSRLFEPIGALYTLPKYGEADLTPYFAPFYMLFFGICLGDIGYGLLLVIAGFIVKKYFPSLRGYASLVQVLGIGAIFMSALSGGIFGMSLTDASFLPESVRGAFLNNIQLFWFAILFGAFQVIFARAILTISAMARKGWKHGMSNIGWIGLILWCVYAYASSQVESLSAPPFPISMAWLGVSVVLILFFTKIKGNIFSRFGSGLASLYDITGVFGDVLSYIRLFGLGTAGAILGLVVNNIAMSMAGGVLGWFFALVMLLFGHTLVLLLSCLGAFVHPMRLTFVEFYKNAGFEGGGRPFSPLK